MLLLYDDAQSIYRRSRGLDFSLPSVGIKAAGRSSILRLNCRHTREILQFACDFASRVIGPQAADDDHTRFAHDVLPAYDFTCALPMPDCRPTQRS